MIRHGEPPYLECSSHGDRRFSALYARIQRRDNRTIEDLYQSAKILPPGHVGGPKGVRAVNQEDCATLYRQLWREYILENRHLYTVLRTHHGGLSDKFGQPGHCCQATELWIIKIMGI